jgi:hypothetical protein
LAAVVVAATAAAADLSRWLVIMSPTPLSAAFVIVRLSTLSPPATVTLSHTFTSHCHVALVPAVHFLRRSHQWLVVAFSAHQATYQLNHEAEIVSSFRTLGLILTYLE